MFSSIAPIFLKGGAITRLLLVIDLGDTFSECSECGALCQINIFIRALITGIMDGGSENRLILN